RPPATGRRPHLRDPWFSTFVYLPVLVSRPPRVAPNARSSNTGAGYQRPMTTESAIRYRRDAAAWAGSVQGCVRRRQVSPLHHHGGHSCVAALGLLFSPVEQDHVADGDLREESVVAGDPPALRG